MRRSDEVVFVREYGKYEKLDKAKFYEMLGVKEICICQDNLGDTDELNAIHNNIQVKDLDSDSIADFVQELGCDYYLGSTIKEIEEEGHWEAFNDGFNSVNYSSVRFLNYKDTIFASEVFDDKYFSCADTSLFNYICKNEISGIKEIYIKNWW